MNFIIEDKVRVYRCRPNAKIPIRAHRTDAGMDFFYCAVTDDELTKTLHPGESALLGTGIKIAVPSGCMLQIMNKSGIASKKQLVTGACVVDEGYTGEIFVNLQNIGREQQIIREGEKIAQGVFVRIEKPLLYEVTEENVYGRETERGSGALGSTGNT